MKKNDLREFFKTKRNSLSKKNSEELSFEIANRSLKMDIWNHSNYHIFFPIEKNNEIDTKLIIQVVHGKGQECQFLPKTDFKNNIDYQLPSY